ncbi:DNA-binding response regulator, OmpR family, contains REC and winged-helix (wHTH) domain [Variovorax sp. HW608]|nr:DNA-binding response regulator, OmpR family, contains REC and winged-helix (wHTH) domain [Variovorax sp. HW608]
MLAYTLRTREYARRAFRSLGYAPLVFASLDELIELGPVASGFDMLLIGDAPSLDDRGSPVLVAVREAVGPKVPLLHVCIPGGAGAMPPPTDVSTASTGFFGDFCSAILFSLLDASGMEEPPPRLVWGAYAFEPLGRIVGFGGRQVRLDPVSFDIALELFFRAGQLVNKKTLTLMLPPNPQGAERRRIDNIGSVIKELRSSLRLRDLHGWNLETLPHLGYRLVSR